MSNDADSLNKPSTSSSSMTNFDKMSLKKILSCAFCGASTSKAGKTLEPCLFCGAVAYCSTDHQKKDWKRHEMVCKTVQSRGFGIGGGDSSRPTTSQPRTDLTTHPKFNILSTKTENEQPKPEPMFTGFGAFRPYRRLGASSLSSGSVSSIATSHEASLEHMSSSSLQDSHRDFPSMRHVPVRVLTAPSVIAPTSAAVNKKEKEVIVETEDPDIQIIESKTNVRTRKRPTPSNSAELKQQNYKDHKKNVVYSTTLQEHQRHLQNRGLALNIHQAMVLRLRYISEHVIRSLNEFGWAVVDNFLGSDHYKFTAMEIERLYRDGMFSAGQLMEGKNKDEYHIKDIRSDQIYWYDGMDAKAGEAATIRLLISMIDSVIQHFKNRIDHEIGGRSRAMLAIYPGNGTRYVKHVDNPVKDGRCITTIYYCNENWDMVTDGGTLRLYPETSMTPMDIDPRADRVVFFWSDRRNPHEVMPVYRHRFAITIWYMDKKEREKALSKEGGKENPTSTTTKEIKKSEPGPPSAQLLAHPRKNPSSHDLSSLDLRLFPSTSSDPTLGRLVEDNTVEAPSLPVVPVVPKPESIDSGVSMSHSHRSLHERSGSIQSLTDVFSSDRSRGRKSSTSSNADLDEPTDLPPPPNENPEYNI